MNNTRFAYIDAYLISIPKGKLLPCNQILQYEIDYSISLHAIVQYACAELDKIITSSPKREMIQLKVAEN